ncbi:unnamed protein product, partial [Discosporangium mesarthrocarpum]
MKRLSRMFSSSKGRSSRTARTSSPSPLSHHIRRSSWAGGETPAIPLPEEKLDEHKWDVREELHLDHHRLTIFVVYRGGWCMSSQTLLAGFIKVHECAMGVSGQVIAVTSQSQEAA